VSADRSESQSFLMTVTDPQTKTHFLVSCMDYATVDRLQKLLIREGYKVVVKSGMTLTPITEPRGKDAN